MMGLPSKVSVVIPTFNRAVRLKSAIESVLAQTHAEIEIVIVDDGSTDNTASVVRRYVESDRRIKFVAQKNGGAGAARNAGIDISTGEFLLFLDDDDTLYQDAIAVGIASLTRFDKCGWAYSDAMVVDENGCEQTLYNNCDLPHGDIYHEVLSGRISCLTGAIMVRRECLRTIKYNPNILKGQDTDFACALAERYFAAFVESPFVKYTRYQQLGTSLSTKNKYSSLFVDMRYKRIFASDRFLTSSKSFRKEIRSKYHLQMGRGYSNEVQPVSALIHLLKSILLCPNRISTYWDLVKILLNKRMFRKIIN